MPGDIPLQFPGTMLPSLPSSLPPGMQLANQFQGQMHMMQNQMNAIQSALDFLVMHGGGEEEDEEEEEEEEQEEESSEPPPVAKRPGQCFFNTHLHNQCA